MEWHIVISHLLKFAISPKQPFALPLKSKIHATVENNEVAIQGTIQINTLSLTLLKRCVLFAMSF